MDIINIRTEPDHNPIIETISPSSPLSTEELIISWTGHGHALTGRQRSSCTSVCWVWERSFVTRGWVCGYDEPKAWCVLETQWPNCLQMMLTFFQFDNLGHTISPANKIYCINVGYTSSIKFIARMATVIESLTSIKNILRNFVLPSQSGKCICAYRKTFDKIRYQSMDV